MLALVAVLAVNACEPERPRVAARTLESHPRVADRYVGLLRRGITDSNPAAVHQELVCEERRLYRALGPTESSTRMRAADDTAFATAEERAAFDRVLRGLQLRSFETGGPLRDSLNAIADRESPIAPVDSAIRNR
jgi:hypothetical protein